MVEVLRVRYEVSRFLPIIVASVVGAVISRLLLHADPTLSVPLLDLNNYWELPNLILLGLMIGMLAIGFISWCEFVTVRMRAWSNRLGFTLAGLVTGILALWTPDMGSSYTTLDRLLAGEGGLGLGLVLAVTLTKLAATGTAVGLRVPGGLIGPTLFIGGAAGSVLGMLFGMLEPMDTAPPAFYATVGMAAMMGASLRAPLAALIALLELTGNPNVILPGMLAVAAADITNQVGNRARIQSSRSCCAVTEVDPDRQMSGHLSAMPVRTGIPGAVSAGAPRILCTCNYQTTFVAGERGFTLACRGMFEFSAQGNSLSAATTRPPTVKVTAYDQIMKRSIRLVSASKRLSTASKRLSICSRMVLISSRWCLSSSSTRTMRSRSSIS